MTQALLPGYQHTIFGLEGWTCSETPGDSSSWRVTHPVDGGDIFVSKKKAHSMLDAIQYVGAVFSAAQVQAAQNSCEHGWMAFPGAHPDDLIGDMCWKCGVAL